MQEQHVKQISWKKWDGTTKIIIMYFVCHLKNINLKIFAEKQIRFSKSMLSWCDCGIGEMRGVERGAFYQPNDSQAGNQIWHGGFPIARQWCTEGIGIISLVFGPSARMAASKRNNMTWGRWGGGTMSDMQGWIEVDYQVIAIMIFVGLSMFIVMPGTESIQQSDWQHT